MAKDVSGNVWKFDATGQAEGYGPSLDSAVRGGTPVTHTVNYDVPLKIKQFKIETGSGGDVLIYSRKIVGTEDPTQYPKCDQRQRYTVLSLDSTPASDTLWVPMGTRVDGIYIETLPTNAVVWAYMEDGN